MRKLSDLFRKEAIAYATRRLAGDVLIASSLSMRLLSGLAVAGVAIAMLFAATATYARKETVTGWITPGEGMIRLTARQGGVITALHVAEGQSVEVGAPVATVSLSQGLQGGDSFVILADSLQAQRDAAQGSAEAALDLLRAEEAQLRARRAGLSRELAESRRRAKLQSGRIELARDEVSNAETIAAQGFLPRRELEARRGALLRAEEEGSELTAATLGLERAIGEVDARLAALPIDARAVRAEAQTARASLLQQTAQTEAQSTYQILASVRGRVAALPLDRGQTAQPGASIAILVAGDAPLEAELYVPSRAAGFIRPGQRVRLMYEAFPHQKFGTGDGRVVAVSRTVLAPSEVSLPGVTLQEPVFRVRVALNADEMAAYGETLPLRPGMLLNADVIIDRRTLLEWLLDPLYAAGRRS